MQPDEYPKLYRYRRLVQAKLFIDQHFTEKINLNAIADEAYFSKYHFIRLFKTSYGYTPHQYLIRLRIEKARLLLSRPTLRIEDVSYAVGFESLYSFSLLFKKQIGQTPTQFRQHSLDRTRRLRLEPRAFIPSCLSSSGYVHDED
ncbi:AraC family transcriptional regulator [Spirosoma sp. HMF3257]|uniref:AraC family transcriptional regulator n=1 Tax=Spirosoma telluris TaxID=2183553 RepID=A0A327NRP4_9BACT|nr:AraC family transcriptional regulator [Spirosoma telluris]RAI75398.1 AraC family transcriptional regulator [Spirosoma telluris]